MKLISNREKYVSLSTRKRDGSVVNTPVWFVFDDKTNSYYFYTQRNTGKVKRIMNFPQLQVVPCNAFGKLKGDWIDATADLINDSGRKKIAYSLLRKKYGIFFRIGDCLSWISRNYNRRQIVMFKI